MTHPTETSPYASPLNPTSQTSSGLSEGVMVKNWLIFIVVATIGGTLAGMLAGAVTGGLLGASGAPPKTIQLAGGIAGALAGLPVSYLTFRWRLKCLFDDNARTLR